MVKKHNVVYLSDVGAFALRNPMGKNPHMQWLKGFHSAIQGRTLLGTIAKTFVRAEPYYLKGYFDGAKIKKNA